MCERGGGDADANNVKPPGAAGEWRELPNLVQWNIFDYLDGKTLNRLREVSTSLRDEIELQYGVDVVVPIRDWSFFRGISIFGLSQRTLGSRRISDSTVWNLLTGLKGKVIRKVGISETPPPPLSFNELFHHPRRLQSVALKYVDVSFLQDILTHSVNLRSLSYKTGLHRPMPSGPIAWLLIQDSFTSHPKPKTRQEFVSFVATVPDHAIELTRLTSLSISLSLTLVDDALHGDWANVVFILLGLPPTPNLKNFSFNYSSSPIYRLPARLYFSLMGCLTEFMSKRRSLRKLTCHSLAAMVHDGNVNRAQPFLVIASLAEKYGSEHLLSIINANDLGELSDSSREAFEMAGRSLQNLEEVNLTLRRSLRVDSEEALLLRSLQFAPAVRKWTIDEVTAGWPEQGIQGNDQFGNGFFRVIIHRNSLGNQRARFQNLEQLRLRTFRNFRVIRLNNLIASLPNIRILEIEYFNLRTRPPLLLLQHENVVRIHALHIQGFVNLTTLQLVGLRIENTDAIHLSQCTNLKILKIWDTDTGASARPFDVHGVLVQHILTLLTTLRHLDKIEMRPVIFRREEGARLTRQRRNALQSVGILRELDRVIDFQMI